ncbi:MAG: AsmA-like C-terminal region-containing protein, partial [Burkholderiales bacterium]
GTDYRAIVDIGAQDLTLQFDSDLVGLTSSLPAPFAKEAAEAWPLRVVSRPIAAPTLTARPSKGASFGDRIDLTLGNTAAMSVERERDAGSDRLTIRRGGVAIGAEPVLRDTGLSVLVRGSELDLDVWRKLLSDSEIDRMKKSGSDRLTSDMSIVPEFVSVVVDDLRIGGQRLHDVVFGASRQAERWQANIASREVEGHLNWIDAVAGQRTGTVEAQLDRLILPRSRESDVESALSVTSSMLPGLKLDVNRLVLGEVELGRVGLDATNRGTAARPVWDIDRLTLDNSDSRVTGHGTWVMTPAASPPSSPSVIPDEASRGTTLAFSIDIVDAGKLQTRVGIKDALKGGSGSFDGKVQWQGSPFDIDVQTLSGDLQLKLGEGAFLRVDPGVAKLIGVLSLSALPKRLAGDFRDVFGEGFAFDTIRGSIAIDKGIARTDDLNMHGTQANVTLRGEVDLIRETQRLRVEVVPDVNAGLAAVAVGAMINPVIGLGTLAAQYVLRGPLQQALAIDVDINGSWADPEVRERSRHTAGEPAREP